VHRQKLLTNAFGTWQERPLISCSDMASPNNGGTHPGFVAALRLARVMPMRRAFISWQLHSLQERLVRHMSALHSRRFAVRALQAWAAVSAVSAAEAKAARTDNVQSNASPAALGALLKFQAMQNASLSEPKDTLGELQRGPERLTCDESTPKLTSAALLPPLAPEAPSPSPVSQQSHSLCGRISRSISTESSPDSTATLSLPGRALSSKLGTTEFKEDGSGTCNRSEGERNGNNCNQVQDQVDLSPPQLPSQPDLSLLCPAAGRAKCAAWPAWISPTKTEESSCCPQRQDSSSTSVVTCTPERPPTPSQPTPLTQAFVAWYQAFYGQV
jgi:hypothetical protein